MTKNIPKLTLVGTPIGNLADISFRALEVLSSSDLVLAEDTRHSRKLLERHGVTRKLVSLHKFNEVRRCEMILSHLEAGREVALITDSGMPGVSDPGARVVKAVTAAGFPVSCVPGPSAVTTAAALSGLCEGGFNFAGFLPQKPGKRRKHLQAIVLEFRSVIFFESPYRVLRMLEDLTALAPDRSLFMGRELTKKFEECWWGSVAELADRFESQAPRGEFVFVLASENHLKHQKIKP